MQLTKNLSYRFPLNDSIRRKWLSNLRRKNWSPKEWDRVCSQHFQESCFVTIRRRRCLKQDAVPTIFAFPRHMIRRSPRLRRTINSRNAAAMDESSNEDSAQVPDILLPPEYNVDLDASDVSSNSNQQTQESSTQTELFLTSSSTSQY